MLIFSRYLFVIGSVLALQACSTSQNSTDEGNIERIQPVALKHTQLSKDQTSAAQFISRGLLVVGHETRTFTPCGSNQQYWVNFDKTQLNAVQALTSTPYQPMYAELIGTLSQPSPTGFDRDFTARLNVSAINLVSAENPKRCTTPFRSTRVFGNEPSWSIRFLTNGIEYKKVGTAINYDLVSSQLTPEKRQYQFTQGQLNLSRASCHDSMSDSIYGWSAEFNLDNKKYNGCATLSNIDNTQNWAGTYQANSTAPAPFSITLELNTDHSAKTYYRYDSNEAERRETGYWQQINPTQVQVVMTHHQGQRLVSERIFSKQDDNITAEKEKINGNIYTISNGGLVLFKNK